MKNKNIIVNGVEREVDYRRLSHNQLVMLAPQVAPNRTQLAEMRRCDGSPMSCSCGTPRFASIAAAEFLAEGTRILKTYGRGV